MRDGDEAHEDDWGEAFGDDRVAAGVQHLQAAAREAIAAARALLDVAEDLVADPAAVATVVGAMGSAARDVARFAAGGRAWAAGQQGSDDPGADDADGSGGIERIRVR